MPRTNCRRRQNRSEPIFDTARPRISFLSLIMSTTVVTTPPVTLLPSAAEEIKGMLALPENAGKHFRVYVEQGGCSGMQYAMVFDERRDGDLVSEQAGVTVLVDTFSLQYLRGAQVDFSDALSGGGFKISNPNAKESCGCGKSFQT